MTAWPHVQKVILSNGLTVLVVPNRQIPKVSVQLWYNIGSKDEQTGEKGIAHLIEHMIFKGTEKLSESDINLITHKLSGSCNAFTSHDYTGYLFDLPSQHWKDCLPIMADCMQHCTFKQTFLNSELKAVIQELKMYQDDYASSLIESMMSNIFADHPYHYPIIGYKQDLWSLQREALLSFYERYYVPNNAALIIVGDVDPEEAFFEAASHFESIAPDDTLKKRELYHGFDLKSQSVTLYRDVQNPICLFAWVVPGVRTKKDYVLDALSWIIGSGKGSRLYQVLVEEKKIATETDCFVYDLFDYSVFFIQVQPTSQQVIAEIEAAILYEIEKLAGNTITEAEINRAVKKISVDFLSLSENNQQLAYLVGKYFIATGEEAMLANYGRYPYKNLMPELKAIITQYLRPSLMSTGKVLPILPQDLSYWRQVQEQSDVEDVRILSTITRDSGVEEGEHVHEITVKKQPKFDFPQPKIFTLKNGLKVFAHHTTSIPKIDLIIDLAAKHFYDPEDQQGLNAFLYDMLQEGTERYSAQALAQEIESSGMTLATFPGQILMSMLSSDVDKGLSILSQVLTQATLPESSLEKVRTRILTDIKDLWDTPTQCVSQLVREKIYAGHPYHKSVMGTIEGVNSITREDLLKAYQQWVTPQKSRIAIVGDFSNIDIENLLEKQLGSWQGPDIELITFPALKPIEPEVINHPMNRDQVVLAYAGLSVTRFDPDFDALLIFDQIFTGGVLGSMSSRLFDLRERSGLFYTIGGSLLARVDDQPGLVFIRTIISNDRLHEAEGQIEQLIDQGAQDITEQEMEESRNAIINSLVDHFASNKQMAATFLFLDQFKFTADFFTQRPEQLARVTIADVQRAVSRVLNSKKLIKVRAGRV